VFIIKVCCLNNNMNNDFIFPKKTVAKNNALSWRKKETEPGVVIFIFIDAVTCNMETGKMKRYSQGCRKRMR